MLPLTPMTARCLAAGGFRRMLAGVARPTAAGPLSTAKAWNASTFDAAEIRVKVPAYVEEEIRATMASFKGSAQAFLAKYAPSFSADGNGVEVPSSSIISSTLSKTQEFVRSVEAEHLINGRGFALVSTPTSFDSIEENRFASAAMACALGQPLRQNAGGDLAVLVFDRDASRSMADGQRYHQSHEGGSLHTDNVNVPQVWEHMLLTCLQPSVEGGETILVSSTSIYNHMCQHAPRAIDVLQQDFLWEFRGFSDKFYRAPILYFNRAGEPCFRWLRDYLESAYVRTKTPMTEEQRWALDTLTETSLLPELQTRLNMHRGDILFANDVHLFHGRTAFKDAQAATEEYDFSNPVNRLMQRVWVRTSNPEFAGINQSHYSLVE